MVETLDHDFMGRIEKQDLLNIFRKFHTFERDTMYSAVQELRTIDIDRLFGLLRQMIVERDIDLRFDTATAAVVVDARRGVDLILPLLNDPDDAIRWHICGLLYDFGDERAVQPLIQALQDDDYEVRLAAVYALGNIGDERALPALEQLFIQGQGMDNGRSEISSRALDAINAILARQG